MLLSGDKTSPKLTKDKFFFKLDANSGFLLNPFKEKSKLHNTHRKILLHLLLGIDSALEHFQQRMLKIVEGILGVLCKMDDILIFGDSKSEHDKL